MSKIKKILCMLLVCAMITTQCSLFNTVFAQTEEDEPLKIEVSTDKSSYSSFGIANITVTVTNTSDETINNISAEAVFSDLAPINKKASETFKEVESLQSGESFSFSYKVTLNANKVNINFFEKIILWFVRLFNGGYTATTNNFDENREFIENNYTIKFGNYFADNSVRVWYEALEVEMTDEEYEEALETCEEIEYELSETQLSNEYKNLTTEEKKTRIETILNEYKKQGIIKEITYNDSNCSFSFEYSNGLLGGVVIENKHSNCFSVSANQAQPFTVTRSVSQNQTDTYSYNEIDFLFVFGANSKEDVSSYKYLNHLKNEYANLDVNTAFYDNATVNDYKDLDNFDLIYIMSHGSYDNSIPFICTNEIATKEKRKTYKKDFNSANLAVYTVEGQSYFWILPSFFEDNYKNQELDNSIVLLSCCNAFGESNRENYLLATSLKKAGAGAVIGFCNSVDQSYSNCFYEKMIYQLSQGNTVIESFNQSKNIIGENEKIFFSNFSNSSYQKDYVPYPLISIDKSIKLFNNALEGFGTFTATVKDENSKEAIENVGVAIYNTNKPDLIHLEKTNSNGVVSIDLPEGEYICKFSHDNYENSITIGFTIEKNVTTSILNPVYLSRTTSSVSGSIKDKETNVAVSGVTVEVFDKESNSSTPVATTTTNENGGFSLALPYGSYSFKFLHNDYEYYEVGTSVNVDYVTFGVLLLTPKGSSSGGNNSTGGEDEKQTVTDSGTCGDNLTWTLYDDGELVISGTGDMKDWSSVSSVPWYSSRSLIKNVSIHSGITSIGDMSFYGCVTLTNITIPKGVTSIGGHAFASCASLTNITFPSGVATIGWRAFDGCTSLTNIVFPSGVTAIGMCAFDGCTSLENISISDSVTNINRLAFVNCPNLKDITVDSNNSTYSSDKYGVLFNKDKTILIQYPAGNNRTSYNIPNSVTSIGDYAFENSDYLANVEIPTSVTSVGDDTFNNCNSLNNITIPNSVTSIGADAFASCSALERIALPNTLKSIGARAFYRCISLKEITIPGSVKSIGERTFENCTALENVSILEGVISIGAYAFDDCDSLVNITIPSSITSTGTRAFYSCNSLKNVTISNGITSIGAYLFDGCTSLENITLPDSVKIIGDGAFNCCYSLKNIYIPNSVTTIGEHAFNSCSALKSITLPDSVTAINQWTFHDCIALESITIPENVTSIGFRAFWRCTSLRNVTIPNNVTSIGDYAFSGCTSLNDITIPSNVSSIGGNIFENCTSLTNISISENVTSIGNGAFSGCSSLTNIEIPDSVTNIGGYAFYGCYSLVDITIPDNVTEINGYTFAGCKSLRNILIPDRITSIGTRAFSACSSLKDITLPNSVTVIEDNAFSGCRSLENIIIPNNVTSIGEEAFSYCTALKNITITRSVINIEYAAFLDCSNLTNVYYQGSKEEWNKISIDFYNTCLTNATIHYNS